MERGKLWWYFVEKAIANLGKIAIFLRGQPESLEKLSFKMCLQRYFNT